MATKTITTELVRQGRTFGQSIPPWLTAVRAVTGNGRTNDVVGDEVRANGHLIAHLTQAGQYAEICGKCGGSGHLPEYGFVAAGVCFSCGGGGVHLHKDGSLKELVKILDRRKADQARRDAKAAAKHEAQKAAAQAWKQANPAAAETIAAVLADMDAARRSGEDFGDGQYEGRLRELAMHGNLRVLTDAQAAFMVKLYREHHERQAKYAAEASARQWLGSKGEKIEFTGVVTFTEHRENPFGPGTITKHRIKDAAGNMVIWDRSGWSKFAPGDTLTVKATIKKLLETEKSGKLTVITRGTIVSSEVAAKNRDNW